MPRRRKHGWAMTPAPRAPTQAFNYNQITWLKDAAGTLFSRMSFTNTHDLTHEDIMKLICPDERTVQMLTEAAQVAHVTGRDRDAIDLGFKFTNQAKTYIQLNPVLSYQPPFPPKITHWEGDKYPEIVAKIQKWVDYRVWLGNEFGVINALIAYFGKQFKRPEQVRYAWPGIVALTSVGDQTNDAWQRHIGPIKAKVSDFVPTDTPAIPVEMREACKRTASVLTRALLLPEDIAPPVEEVHIQIYKLNDYTDPVFGEVNPF